ncbi:MAG: sigma-70 family RNA polymerase sigma factor [Acidobacteriota bacterium]
MDSDRSTPARGGNHCRGDRTRHRFSQLWEEHGSEIFKRCLGWTGGRRDDAEEAFSRAAMTAFQNFPRQPEALTSARGWLLRIAYNTCMDLHRERRRSRVSFQEDLDALPSRTLGAPRRNPERLALDAEMQRVLLEHLAALPARLREPMELHFLHGVRYRQIAERLAITEVNVRKRIQHGRQILRRGIERYRDGDSAPPPAASARKSPPALRLETRTPAQVRLPTGVERDVELPCFAVPASSTEARVRNLERYIARHPRGWKRRLELARTLRSRGDLEAALGHYRAVVERDAVPAAVWIELGSTLSSLGEHDACRATYRRALQRQHRQDLASHLRALLAGAEGQWEEALGSFRQAQSQNGRNPTHGLTLAATALELGRLSDAAEALAGVLPLAADQPTALITAHDLAIALGRERAARRHLAAAYEQAPADHAVLERLLRHRAAGRQAAEGETFRLLEALRAAAPDRAETVGIEARLLVARGYWHDGLRSMAEFVDRRPHHARGWSLLAQLLANTGNHRVAAQAAATACQLDPEDRRAARKGWKILDRAGQDELADHLLAKLLRDNVQDAFLLRDLLEHRAADPPEAGDLPKLWELLPTEPGAWFACARRQLLRRRWTLALDAFHQGWQRLPSNDAFGLSAAAALDAAFAARKLDDRCAAQGWFQRAVDHSTHLGETQPAHGLALQGLALQQLDFAGAARRALQAALRCGLLFPLRETARWALRQTGS